MHLLFPKSSQNCEDTYISWGNFRLFFQFSTHIWQTYVCFWLFIMFFICKRKWGTNSIFDEELISGNFVIHDYSAFSSATTARSCQKGCGHPRKVRTPTTTATIQEPNVQQDLDLNDRLPTLYPIRSKVRQPTPVPPPVIGPPPTPLYNVDETALKNIHKWNLQDNVDLTRRTAAPRPPNDLLQTVTEVVQPAIMETHFPCLRPLTTTHSKDLQLKTRGDIPHQKVINKIVDQLNSKTMHIYNLPFALDTLRKSQRKDVFFSDIIKYLVQISKKSTVTLTLPSKMKLCLLCSSH